jgi:thiamine kinase-like enzyme
MDINLITSLAQRFGWNPASLVVSPLSGGLTNQNHRISTGSEDFVLRLFGSGTELLGIDRQRELHCSRVAASLGIGAEVIHADDNLMLTRFISGPTLKPEHGSQRLHEVATSLKKYHAGPDFPGSFSAFETVRVYAKAATERGLILPPKAQQALDLAMQLESALGAPSRLVPCHNDLLAGNFIDDGSTLRIIDWEYAAMGDLFFDLGNFAANQELSIQDCERLLRAYFGGLRDEDMARLLAMQRASNLREAFWGLLQSTVSGLDFDYVDYANTYLDKAL